MPNDSTVPGFSGLTCGGKRYITVERWSRRRPVRRSVIAVFAFVSGIAVIAGSHETFLLWLVSLTFTVLFISWPILHGTYVLHRNKSVSLHAGYRIAGDTAFGELQSHHAAELTRLGFTPAGCLEKEPDDPRVTIHVAIFVHEESGNSAQLARIRNSLSTIYLVAFATRFRNGLVVETSDSFRTPIFRPKSKYQSFRFPRVRTVSSLYFLHQAITKEYEASRIKLRETRKNALSNFMEAAEEIHVSNMEQGEYKLTPTGDRYVYTWRGAFRHSLLHAWPMSTVRAIRANSQAEKKCKQLGYRIIPKLGRIEPIVKQTRIELDPMT